MESFRGKSKNPKKLRNLKQFRDLPEEVVEAVIAGGTTLSTESDLRNKIEEKLTKFSDDYDISDLKINDYEVLVGLIRDIIAVEDYERFVFSLRKTDGISVDNLLLIKELQRIISDIKDSISKAQNDLNITRRHRKSSQEQSVVAFIADLKEKARKFKEATHLYVFCPKCNTLLATVWSLYPDESGNKLTLVCRQKDSNGNPCGNKFTVDTKTLLEKRGTNNMDVIPESML